MLVIKINDIILILSKICITKKSMHIAYSKSCKSVLKKNPTELCDFLLVTFKVLLQTVNCKSLYLASAIDHITILCASFDNHDTLL